MGMFDVQAACNRMWGRASVPFSVGMLVYVLMFYMSLKSTNFYSVLNLFLKQNIQHSWPLTVHYEH